MDEVSLLGTQLETEAGAGSGQHDTKGIWWWCEAGRKECGTVRGTWPAAQQGERVSADRLVQGTVFRHRSGPPHVGAKHWSLGSTGSL